METLLPELMGSPGWPPWPHVLLRLGMAVLLAGALGLERESRGRPAGLRTHILVCLGATLLMIVSEFLAAEFRMEGAPTWLDRGRIAAGIITGIGFLGAGTIITISGEQRGLTTAAMIWFVAALGIAIGAGFYFTSVVATAMALLIVVGLRYVEFRLSSHDYFTLTVTVPSVRLNVEEMSRHVMEAGAYRAVPTRIHYHGQEQVAVTFRVDARAEEQFSKLIMQLRAQYPEITELELVRR